MTHKDIIRKLSSRKFWMALSGFVSMLIVALGGTETEGAKVAALIMAGASVLAYILAEGWADATHDTVIEEILLEEEKPPED